MQLKYKLYRIVLPLLLAALLIPAISGCGSDDPTELTQQELEQILDEAITATSEADTFTMSMDMNLNAGDPEADESVITAGLTGSGTIDTANEAMKMAMNVSFSMDMGFMDFSMDDIAIEVYQLDGWQYQHMSVPDMDMGDEWTKTPVTHDDTDIMDPDYLKDQIETLKSSAKLEGLRMEQIDGVDCYVIKVTPDAQKIADWISTQSIMTEEIPADELQQFEDLMDRIDITIWTAKDEGYLVKFALDATIDTSELEGTAGLAPEEAGLPIMADGTLIMDISVSVTMSDYNKDVDITLPPEAANAEEGTPGGIFEDILGGDPMDREGLDGMFDEEFNPDQFSDMFGDGEFDMEQFEGLFGDMDLEELREKFGDMDMDELFELLEDEDIDFEELSELFKKLDISFE